MLFVINSIAQYHCLVQTSQHPESMAQEWAKDTAGSRLPMTIVWSLPGPWDCLACVWSATLTHRSHHTLTAHHWCAFAWLNKLTTTNWTNELMHKWWLTCIRGGLPLGSFGMPMKLQATITEVSMICKTSLQPHWLYQMVCYSKAIKQFCHLASSVDVDI